MPYYNPISVGVIAVIFVLLGPGYRLSRVGRVCQRKAVWVQERTSRAEGEVSLRLSAVVGGAAVVGGSVVGGGSRV